MGFSNTIKNKPCQPKMIDFLVLATAVIVTSSTIVWLLVYSRYGIDLTDEGYYLLWMSNPWIYPVSVTQFGFIYHPLYLLFHGDITLLRQANILIIFGLAWVLCMVFFRATIDKHVQSLSWYRLPMIALSAVISTCSLVYFCPHGWLATPSYNSLTFQAMLLSSIGLLLAEKTVSPVSITGWLLLGLGGWLSFMAKPTSAIALGVAISVCLVLSSKFNLRLIAISLLTTTALLIASAWVIDGSLIIFIERFRGGIAAARLLGSEHFDMFRIDNLLMGRKAQIFFSFSIAITFGAICLAASKTSARMMAGHGFALLFALMSLLIISERFLFQAVEFREYYFSFILKDLLPPPTRLILAVPLSALTFCFVLMRWLPSFKVSRTQWTIALYFAMLPHISAFGTTQNYWLQGSLNSLFWILAGLVILMPAISICGNWRILLPAVMSGQLIAVFLLQAAMEQPYFGQPEPFRQYNNVIAFGVNESELILPQALVEYYRNVKKMAIQAGFQSGAPMLDMTGEGPGTLYAIGAKAIGQPWMIGGHTGSDNMAIAVLNRVACKDIAEAWLLVDPDSRLKLSLNILSHFGLSIEQNFEMAAELSISSESVARHGVPSRRLQLWKPTNPTQDTIAACEKKRNQI
jgi:hypothetical protein